MKPWHHHIIATRFAFLAQLASCTTHAGKQQQPHLSPAAASGMAALPFQKNQCFSKGGLGIIARRVFVVLDSDKNELLLPDGGRRWTRLSSGERECVFVLRGKVFSANELPRDFHLEQSVAISFEGEKVTFFDFSRHSGGFYRRWKNR